MARRIVLVTGASRGLGRELALAFAADGAHVLGTGRDEAELERTAGLCEGLPGTFAAHRLDVRDGDAVDALFEAVGRLDVCVANAGIAEQRPLAQTDEEDLRRLLEVNVVGAFAVMRRAAAVMVAQGGGRIVPIASDAAYIGIPTMAPYVASKHALLGLARTLALELAGTGVYLTTVFPGGIQTEILGEVSLGNGGMDVADAAAAIAAIATTGPSIGSSELHLQPARRSA
ncbi:MAG TPA: SDR family oxidoreductase [Conexibacter sp.]|nr:SDR family oxidoreductase [Conexibacter sp.]